MGMSHAYALQKCFTLYLPSGAGGNLRKRPLRQQPTQPSSLDSSSNSSRSSSSHGTCYTDFTKCTGEGRVKLSSPLGHTCC
jgi:hypothetical protein